MLVGYKTRFPVTQPGYRTRFPVTYGYMSLLHNPVPGYTWLRKSVTKLGFQLRMVTLVGYTTRFSVTHGYENSKKRCATQGSALPVTDLGYAFV